MSKSDDNQEKWLNEFLEATKETKWATKLQEFLDPEEQLRSLFPTRFGPGKDFSPKPDSKNQCRVFRAFELVEPSKVECLVIGLDPYSYASGRATGVAFLVPDETKDDDLPPSFSHLVGNLFPGKLTLEDCTEDAGSHRNKWSRLEQWASENGVLLINAALTIQKGKKSGSDLDAWKKFTVAVIRCTRKNSPSAEIIALGVKAANVAKDAFISCCYHPAAVDRAEKKARKCGGEQSKITKDFETFWDKHGPLRAR